MSNPQKRKPNKHGHLAALLNDPRMEKYLSRTTMLRLAILAAVVSGKKSPTQVAKEYKVSKQAAWATAKRAINILSRPVNR